MIKVCLAAALCTAAFGSSITYNYTGTLLIRCNGVNNSVNGSCPANYASDYNTASLTFSAPLGANLSNANETSSPNLTGWTMSDKLGLTPALSSTDANASSELQSIVLSTNSSGALVSWGMAAGANSIGINSPAFIGGSGLPLADFLIPNGGNGVPGGYNLGSPIPGTWTEALKDFQGGSASSPVFIGGSPITEISGSISANNPQEFYSFLWTGGAFSATASITGPDTSFNYSFSLGSGSNCSNIQSVGLAPQTYSNSITSVLAPGQYCLGVQTDGGIDPGYDIKLNTPIGGAAVPEPATFGLLAAGLAMIGVVSRRNRLSRRA